MEKKKFDLKQGIIKDIIHKPSCYLLTLPALIYTFIFGYLTLPYILIAFERFNYKTGIFNSEWVGLENFEFFFKTDYAVTVTWNTVKLNFWFIVSVNIMAMFFAILLNEIKNRRFVKITQSTFILPHFLSWIIVSYIIYGIFSSDFGIANKLLLSMNLPAVNWYSVPEPWTWILIIMRVWKGTGINTVIFLAAIAGIDNQIYEASIIDGANRWQQIKSITIPLLMPTVTILVLLAVGRIFYGDFGMIYSIVRDNGTLFSTTDVIDTFVYRALRKVGDPSWAMAIGLYQSVMGFIFVFGTNLIARKYFKEGALF